MSLKKNRTGDIVVACCEERMCTIFLFPSKSRKRIVMNIKVSLYIISVILAVVGVPTVLVLVYLNLIDSGISSKFFWTASLTCCVLSVLFFLLARVLSAWEEEDEREGD